MRAYENVFFDINVPTGSFGDEMMTSLETLRLDLYETRILHANGGKLSESETNEFISLFQKRIDDLDDTFYGAKESFDIVIEAAISVANMKEHMGLTEEEGKRVMDTFFSIIIRRCKLRR